jgi:hypothetical protein
MMPLREPKPEDSPIPLTDFRRLGKGILQETS